ncbi:ubiquinone biosynthesis protein COQ9 [Aspergillus japonicus CBS 114.51]|uniref:Ubiquinone biosynthesis protein n=1 Tax=Aspergillus japonicus CBS 114.51 TaxID=1448312 RepID=A0A8T8X8Y8_ASPJA|nr:ubiquinone biosynthesis protein COQ9 [Aspergillus japonicus CBS 114.51]RAH84531.1 ubiquinone biosynthesis protein COQ9 [Aspergillus japonicus CBS 114.51]
MTRPTSLLPLTRRGLCHASSPRAALPLAPRTHLRQPQSQIHTTTRPNNRTLNPRAPQTTSPTPLRLSHSPRTYHSDHHPTPPHDYTNSQTTILSAALHHVPTHGFSRNALTLGARDAGFLDVSVQLLPRGEFDLILFWLASRRGLLRSKVESDGLFSATTTTYPSGAVRSVDDKIQILLMERLRMNAEVKDQWQDALAVMSLGENIPLSLSELHALADDILNLAGDKSVDASWYSKRMAVAAVYAASDFVMTRDTSAGLRETEEFVARRWADARAVGDKLTGVRECLGFMGSTAVGLGRSWGLKI